jgi:hypothetical protein
VPVDAGLDVTEQALRRELAVVSVADVLRETLQVR